MLGRHKHDAEVPHLIVESQVFDGLRMIVAAGALDIASAQQFVSYCENEVTIDRPIQIDLANVGFIDSTGLSALLHAVKTLRDRGVPVRVVRAAGQALHLFDMSGLRDVLMGESDGTSLPAW